MQMYPHFNYILFCPFSCHIPFLHDDLFLSRCYIMSHLHVPTYEEVASLLVNSFIYCICVFHN